MDTHESAALRDFAVEIAHQAGDLTLEYFRTDLQVDSKHDDTPVTIADRKAEELLRRRITERYPDHGVLGEEFGEHLGRSPGRWILDPIDGTFSFISGAPLFANLVGFEWEGRMVVGVIHLPALGETVHAAAGLGCLCNDRPARVSNIASLDQACVATTTIKGLQRTGRYAAYARLRDACAHDRGWPDAYGYALLATGRLDVMVDPIMSIWDVAPLLPVIQEAGGMLTDWSGVATHTSPEALATNGRLHAAALKLLQAQASSNSDAAQ